MTRRITGICLASLAVTALAWGPLATGAPDTKLEALTVVPTLSGQPGQQGQQGSTVFEAKPYRFVTSGFITRTAPDVVQKYDAFYCFEGCSRQYSGLLYRPPSSNTNSLGNNAWPAYAADHVYDVPFSVHDSDRGQWTWTGIPHGNSDNASFSGSFSVEVYGEPPPKPCTAPKLKDPEGPSVSFVLTQAGRPKSRPEELTDTITVIRGVAELGERRGDAQSEFWDARDVKATVCHKDRFELEGHPTIEETVRLAGRDKL